MVEYYQYIYAPLSPCRRIRYDTKSCEKNRNGMRKTSVNPGVRIDQPLAMPYSLSSRRSSDQISYASLPRHRLHRRHRVQDPQRGPDRGRPDRAIGIDAAGVHRDRHGNVRGSRCTGRDATGLQGGHQGRVHGDRGRSIGPRCSRGVQQVTRKYI